MVLLFFDDTVRRHALRTGEHRIGRQSTCELVVSNPRISREHAMIVVDDQSVRIQDLGSQNGTRLNGRPVSPHVFVPIENGTVIELGGITFFVRSESTAPEAYLDEPSQKAWAEETLTLVQPTKSVRSTSSVVTRDPKMVALYETADRVAKSDLSILITGETGVGKELMATRIHQASARRNGPFVVLNCAAIPEALLESELFGHERGAFTGADRAKAGLLQAASGGSLFLDEIGELPLTMQAKLLRAVEGGEILAVGASRPRKIDVRFIAATNRDLRQAVSQGRFREDVYHRLNGVSLRIPPLRERSADILPLAEMFARKFAAALNGSDEPPRFDEPTSNRLLAHEWSGNVRELKNVIEGALLLGAGVISAEALPLETTSMRPVFDSTTSDFRPEVKSLRSGPPNEVRREEIVTALAASGGNQADAAKRLGVSRRTLINWLDAHELPRPRKRRSSSD